MAVDKRHTEVSAAEYLGVAPKTLRNWRSRGGGPKFSKLGGAVRYRESALDQFEAERTFDRTQPRSRRRAS